ncbi:hypothetical protein OS493_028417 [Desmophyllum pertusum]|uniref:Uncharacterized protein n=1 Tax=Desmophyllum pertusum TaxID=174260 RepID=A0A9W9ZZF9_9CNID|nr:hypothetical protein OS493_028417 [Desmophyllum pertusum]
MLHWKIGQLSRFSQTETITVGRFTVTTKGKNTGKMELSGDESDDDGISPMMTHPIKVPHKRKPILRKPSFRKVEHGDENPDQAHRKLALYPETASRLEDLTRQGLTGSTTILPGMKLKRSNSDSLTGNTSRATLAREFMRAQGMDSSGRDSKRVSFSKETRGLSDDSRSGSSETGTSSLNTPEMERKVLPGDLYEGLKNSPGTSLVDGRFKANKKKSNPHLANLFDTRPDASVDHADGLPPSQSKQPASMPSSLQNLFAPPQNPIQEKPTPGGGFSLPERPRPRVLPISPLARPESPPLLVSRPTLCLRLGSATQLQPHQNKKGGKPFEEFLIR